MNCNIKLLDNSKRIYYLDYLKLLLILLVIAHHSSETYVINNGWRYKDSVTAVWPGKLHAVNSSFIMGLFFFISGYFIYTSLNKKGTKKFVLSKMKHLLLPVLFILFLVVPAYFYIADCAMKGLKERFFHYYLFNYIGKGSLSYEHGWFLVSLFFYSLFFLLINKIIKDETYKKIGKLSFTKLFIGVIIIALFTYIIRIFYPIDKWITLLGFIGIEPAHFPQYFILFIAGIIGYKNDWLNQITPRIGWSCISIGAIMILILCLTNYLPVSFSNIVYSEYFLYESMMCVAICVALLFIFKKYLNGKNKIFITLSKCSFWAYICHNLFVVIFQVKVGNYSLSASTKFIIVFLAASICSFLNVYIVKKVSCK